MYMRCLSYIYITYALMIVRITFRLLVHFCLASLEIVEVIDAVLAAVYVIYRPEQERITVIGERAWRYGSEAMPDKEHIQAALSATYKQVDDFLW